MHQKSLLAAVLVASASLSFALPASPDDTAINPTHAVLEGFPFQARQKVSVNIDNTCGPSNGNKKCNNHPGGGWCCSEHGFCGNGPTYCGQGCQQAFGKCKSAKHQKPSKKPNPNTPHLPKLNQPKNREERCGPKHKHHKCSKNRCCSHAGYCGNGPEYCGVPNNCQEKFGWCDSKATPRGVRTAGDLRKAVGHLDWGQPIKQCKQPRTLALTFDDGPSNNTEQLLDILRDNNAKATFFISGNNNGKGQIDQTDKWIHAIKRIDGEGHQVAAHTWSHPDMDKISSTARKDEMYKMERALSNIIGKYPTYMRPPYIICGKDCMKDMKSLGYHVVHWGVDSTDWEHPQDLESMIKAVDAGFLHEGENGHIMMIQHDTLSRSAIELTKHILQRAQEKGWKAVTLSECLGERKEDMYRHPTTIDVGAVARGGCVVSGDGVCGQIKPFNGKAECFDSVQSCLKHFVSPMELAKGSDAVRRMIQVCNIQLLFCGQCGTKGGPKCTHSDMKFQQPKGY